jgi:hypothetical protein
MYLRVENMDQKVRNFSPAPVAPPVILAAWKTDQENFSSRPAQANSSQDPISKITKAKWIEVVAQAVQCLLCKRETLSSKP